MNTSTAGRSRASGARRTPLLLLLAAALCLAAAAAAASDSVVTHDFTGSVPRGDALRVVLDVPEADVTVENSDGSDIEVAGTVSREYKKVGDIAAAQKIVDDSSVVVQMEGTRAIVKRHFGPGAQSRSAKGSRTRFAFTVKVPSGMHLELHQEEGEARIAGAFGNITVRLSSGDVTVTTPKRLVKELFARTRVGDAVTNLGDREITNEGFLAPDTHFFNEGGAGVLDVRVTFGDIKIRLTE